MKKYFPVLVSKKGELVALQYLTQNIKDEISPVIEVLKVTVEKEVKGNNGKPTGTFLYDKSLEKNLSTHWSFFGNQIILDFSLFDDIKTKMPFIKLLIQHLLSAGVNVIPAIQSNSNTQYLNFVKDLIKKYACKICMRVSNNSGGLLNLDKQVTDTMSNLKLSSENIILLIDLGQLAEENFNDKAANAGFAIMQLSVPIKKWNDLVVVSGSFPKDLNDIDVKENGCIIDRLEWKIWKTLNSVEALNGIKYGDYGTKNSVFSEVGYAGTISLKYSLKENFIIFKGQKTDKHKDGHGQFITHAKKLVSSSDFYESNFSWGDSRLYDVSKERVVDDKRRTGNSTNWIQYSQNHHITLLHSLL